jgi:hypothetical protein
MKKYEQNSSHKELSSESALNFNQMRIALCSEKLLREHSKRTINELASQMKLGPNGPEDLEELDENEKSIFERNTF